MKRWFITGFVLMLLISGGLLSGCGIQEKKQRSGLQIETGNDQTVAVYLNGTYINQTPLIEKELQPGRYMVKLVPTDPTLVSYEETITLSPGTMSWIIWNPGPSAETSGGTILEISPIQHSSVWWKPMSQKQAQGIMTFSSIPDNAIISIDNEQEVRFTPADFTDLGDKAISFSITLPSYETQAHTINLKPGYRIAVTSKLAKTDALLAATAQPKTILGVSDNAVASTSATSSSWVNILPTQFTMDGKEVLRIRSAPDPLSDTLDYAQVGGRYLSTGERIGDWIKIQTASGSGWVSSSFTQPSQSSE